MKYQSLYTYLTANLPFYILLLFSASIPFSFQTDKIALVVIAALAVVKIIGDKASVHLNLNHLIVLAPSLAFVLMLLVGMLYTEDLRLGWRKIETSLPILAIPFISYTFRNKLSTRKGVEILLSTFVISNFLAIFYSFTALTLNTQTEFSVSSTFNIYTRDNLASQLSIHPVYLALTTATSIQVLFYFLISETRKNTILSNWFYIINIIISFLFILLLGAKMALITVVIAIIFWISVYIITNKKVLFGILLLPTLVASVIGTVMLIPNINKRFVEIQNTPLAPPRGLAHNSINLRVGQLLCSIEVIKANFLLGVGTGDYEKALNSCYEARQYSSVLYQDSYNSHNQYLQSWIMIGFVGLSILILLLLTPVYYSIVRKDWLILSVFSTFIICFLTESYLQSSKGVVLFALFYLIFILRVYLGTKNKYS